MSEDLAGSPASDLERDPQTAAALSSADSCKVTPQMIEAGLSVLEASGRLETSYLVGSDEILVREIYLSMLAHLPPNTRPSGT